MSDPTTYRNPDPRYHVDFPAVTVASDGDALMLVRECGPWAHQATFGFGRPLTFFETDARMRLLRSTDGGRTWAAGEVLYQGLAFDSMLCTLHKGRLLAGMIVGQAGSCRERPTMRGVLHRHLPLLDTVITVRGIGLWASEDNGHTWASVAEVAVPGWENLYNLRRVFELADGTLVLPLTVGYPWRSRYVGLLRSWDGGARWGDPSYVAEDPAGRAHYSAGLGYWQPAMVALPSGDMVCLCVLDDRSGAPARTPGMAGPSTPTSPSAGLPSLVATYSQDAGFTWSAPQPTGLEGDYPSLALLPDGRLLLTHTERGARGSTVLAHTSTDGGASWQSAGIIRQAEGSLFHYAHTVVLGDGSLLTAYMATPPDGVRVVETLRWVMTR